MALSPNEKGTIYIGAQFLFRSRDHGQTWDRISPDLTTNDPEKQKQEESGGVTVDNSEAEMHTSIYSISESPRNGQLIWVGTDDGNLQITRDGGKNVDERGEPCSRLAESVVGFLGGGQPLRRGHGLCGFRPAHLRRHDSACFQDHGFRPDLDADCHARQRRAGLCARHQRGHGFQAAVVPRNGIRAMDFARRRPAMGAVQRRRFSERRRCAISSCIRGNRIWFWPRMAAESGLSTISRRCGN